MLIKKNLLVIMDFGKKKKKRRKKVGDPLYDVLL